MKKTFEDVVKECGLIKAVILCGENPKEAFENPIEEYNRKMMPNLPEGVLEKLSFEEWMAVLRNIHIHVASDLYKKGHQRASELADDPERCEDYLRHFGVENQLDRKVLEKLIATGDFFSLRKVRCRIPYKDSLVAVWMKQLIKLAKKSGKFNYWVSICEIAEPKSPERKLALRKMCELEDLSVLF